jgi:glycine/D-amino acid oxidase-like deaminating enzyme
VVVVGGQAIGACVAAALARKGADVVIIDRPGLSTAATPVSFGWVNSHEKRPLGYHALNVAGMSDYHSRFGSSFRHIFVPSGHLACAADPTNVAALDRRAERLRALGYDVEAVPVAELPEMEPGLRLLCRASWRFPTEGFVHAAALVGHFLGEAQAHGAAHIRGEVSALAFASSGVTVATREEGRLRGDVVVVCAGLGSPALLRSVGVDLPLVAPRKGNAAVGFIATVAPSAARVRHVVTTDRLNLRPAEDGGLVLQAPDLDRDADPLGAVPRHVVDAFKRRLSQVAPEAESAELTVRVASRVLPADGLPLVGPVDANRRVWVAVTHSGITLGPWLGERLAEEILGGESDPRLAEFAVTRPMP